MKQATHHEYLILGAGPAGLQMGYYLEQRGRDYSILEAGSHVGTFFATYPRHRTLISINKVNTGTDDPELNLRWDWNSLLSDRPELRFTRYSGEYFPDAAELLRYLADFAAAYELKIRLGFRVVKVTKPDGFVVESASGERLSAERLILATGLPRAYRPEIPGIELAEDYAEFSVDAANFVNQRVAILGKGNSAFETANALTATAANIHLISPHSTRMAWASHYVGNLRAINNHFLDTYQLKSQNAVLDAEVVRIERQPDGLWVDVRYSHARGQTCRYRYDRVLTCTGFRMDRSIFAADCCPATVHEGKYPDQTPEWESTNVPGLYIAGTLSHGCDYRETMSGFIHGFRYNVRALHQILEHKHHGEELPVVRLPLHVDRVVDHIVERINRDSAMFLQPGFLCDALVVDPERDEVRCHHALPRRYVEASAIGQAEHYYTVSLEYGHFAGDPFAIDRDPHRPETASYLHPVIRRFRGSELVSTHHVNDELENQWRTPEFVEPLAQHLEREISAVSLR